MQEKLPRILVQDLCKGDNILMEMIPLLPVIVFQKPDRSIRTKFISMFTDEAFNISNRSEYGKTGVLSGIDLKSCEVAPSICHCIDRCSAKQQRICHSSYGAEIIACIFWDKRGYALKMALQSFLAQT